MYVLISNFNVNIDLFLLIAVSHALNNEATVSMDLPVKPVLPIASQSAGIASQAKGNFSFILENK
jgi:hypothetical protein